MTESLKKSAAGNGEPEMDARERFHSLLVPLDLTAISDRVLGRVALLPLADGARVTLLHVVPKNLPVRAQERAERDARKSLVNEARHLVKALPKGSFPFDRLVKYYELNQIEQALEDSKSGTVIKPILRMS